MPTSVAGVAMMGGLMNFVDDGSFGFHVWASIRSLLYFRLVSSPGLVIVTRLVLVNRLCDKPQA